jgi:hypothetical protein
MTMTGNKEEGQIQTSQSLTLNLFEFGLGFTSRDKIKNSWQKHYKSK